MKEIIQGMAGSLALFFGTGFLLHKRKTLLP
jgi:hypothetical protein